MLLYEAIILYEGNMFFIELPVIGHKKSEKL